MTVKKNMIVFFRYTMRNSGGEVLENNRDGLPKCYLHGAAGKQPSLQVQFEGLKVGDTKTIYLKGDGGITADDYTFNVIIDDLRPAVEEEQLLGYPVVIDDSICGPNCIC